jgi:shikimate dehydrogenase
VLTPRCAVLGSPIAHSLSPLLHRAAYAHLGLAWEYDAREVREDDLPAFVASLDDSWRGLSLTMPLKRAVVPLLDEMSDRARQARAANTVVIEGTGEGRRLVGHNTDIPGAAAALRERHVGPVDRAVVLGGGATAASVLLALADLGCREAVLLVRDPARAGDTLDAVGRHPSPPAVEVAVLGSAVPPPDVLVSTVPAAAQPDLTGLVAGAGVLFDVVYDPWPTPLALAAADRFVPVVSGHDLLVHQAVLQVELMTGRPVPVSVLRHVLGPRA